MNYIHSIFLKIFILVFSLSLSQANSHLSHVLKHQTNYSKYSSKTSKRIITEAKKYLGIKYKFGGLTRRGLDCSAFTRLVIKKVRKKNIPRTAVKQASIGKHVRKKDLKPGDLVFFKNTYKKGISHVGIYIGHNKFIHASSGAKKVTISSLNKKYYKQHYAGARRL